MSRVGKVRIATRASADAEKWVTRVVTYFLGGLPFHQGGPHNLAMSAITTTTRVPTSSRNAGDDTGGDSTAR